MAVSLYFGLPGCGKTTLLSALAVKGLRKRSPYKHVCCNVRLNIEGITYITSEDLGTYKIEDSLILLDEAAIEFNSREYKNFAKRLVSFFMLHRHFRDDIVLFSQGWDTQDRTIRLITDRVYYVFKGFLLGHWFTRYYRIPYDIIIPDPRNGNEKLGEIVQGYCKPGFLGRLFSGWLYRPKYYKYFDSWEAPELPELPRGRTYTAEIIEEKYLDLPQIPYKKLDLAVINHNISKQNKNQNTDYSEDNHKILQC